MRIAILSDIHGNATALDAVLAHLARDPVDRTICLGDCVQAGAEPAETVARLRALDCPIVMGNADAWLLSGEWTGAPQPPDRLRILEDVRAWSLAQLDAADRAFLAAFAPTVSVATGGREVLGFHGSPASFDEILLPTTPAAEFDSALEPYADRILCGGHVHLQFRRRVGNSFHFNPGSIGLAYRHDVPPGAPATDPWAEYAVLSVDGERIALEFRQVPYDVAAYLARLRLSGRPHPEVAISQYRVSG
jgi:predicted phosphodiesterase